MEGYLAVCGCLFGFAVLMASLMPVVVMFMVLFTVAMIVVVSMVFGFMSVVVMTGAEGENEW